MQVVHFLTGAEAVILVVVLLAILAGFLAGMLTFKVRTRWCTRCGTVKSCPRCARWASSAVSPGAIRQERWGWDGGMTADGRDDVLRDDGR